MNLGKGLEDWKILDCEQKVNSTTPEHLIMVPCDIVAKV